MASSPTTSPWKGIPATGPILRPKAAAEYLGYSPTRFYTLVARGDLPKPIKIGRGASNAACGVPKPWLDALIASCAAESN